MAKHFAFIDEFGSHGFKFHKEGVSTHFILSIVLVNRKQMENNIPLIKKIRDYHFQGSEIKSSKVSNNHRRRKKVLSDIADLDFKVLFFSADKEEIYSEGLRQKSIFYKHFHAQIESRLFQTFPDLEISADRIGGNEFMRELAGYINDNHRPDLFSDSVFQFVKSEKDERHLHIQIADFITGSIARKIDRNYRVDKASEYLEIFNNKILEVVKWPESIKPYTHLYEDGSVKDSSFSKEIAEQSVNLAKQFINNYKNKTDENRQDQVICLRYLLFYFEYINFSHYVSTEDIIENLQNHKGTQVSKYHLRVNVIAPLRDKRVLITTRNKGGYKLPSSLNDVYNFVNHTNSIVLPMLGRLKKFRSQLNLATKGELDILERDDFNKLQELMDYYQ